MHSRSRCQAAWRRHDAQRRRSGLCGGPPGPQPAPWPASPCTEKLEPKLAGAARAAPQSRPTTLDFTANCDIVPTKESDMRRLQFRSFLLSTSLLALLATAAFPQGERATITGTVTDTTQAIIAGARVTLRNVATNIATTTESNAAGVYV